MKLKSVYGKWMVFAEKIGNFQALIVFSILYFILVFPTGFIMNFLNDFLKTKGEPRWDDFVDNTSDINKMTLQ